MAPEGNPSHPTGLISPLLPESRKKIQLGPPCWHFGPERIVVSITGQHYLQVSGFPKENKMAAELPTLISSFLESKPETYAPFFLECVDSKQQINAEVSKYHSLFCGFPLLDVFWRLFSSVYHVQF